MPPSSKPASKSRRPAFKPPRPSSTTKPPQPKAKPKQTPKGKTPRRKSAPATTTLSSSDDELHSVHLSDSSAHSSDPAFDEPLVDAFDSNPPRNHTTQSDPPPTIPPALLTRLLHHHLNKNNNNPSATTSKGQEIKTAKSATPVLGKYFEIFVQEAIARAEEERRASEKEALEKGTGEGGDGFLEVEHLEKLVPQLVMDF